MKKTLSKMVILTIIFLSFSGCTVNETGETISAFFNRLNAINEAYEFSPDNLIFDEKTNSYSRFVKFNNEDEILLNFEVDKRNNLATLNIVTGKNATENESAYSFIVDAISAFCSDEATANKIIEKTDLKNSLKATFFDTKAAECDGIKIEIDTTEPGTVISLHKDI